MAKRFLEEDIHSCNLKKMMSILAKFRRKFPDNNLKLSVMLKVFILSLVWPRMIQESWFKTIIFINYN